MLEGNDLAEAKLNDRMTMSELKKYIADATNAVNEKLKNKRESDGKLTRPEKRILSNLQEITTSKGTDVNTKLFQNLKGKKVTDKPTLLTQARNLRTFLKLEDDYQLEHGRFREYETFKRTMKMPNLTQKEYLKMVDVLSSFGDNFFKNFDSKQVVNLMKTYDKVPTVNVIKLLQDMNSENSPRTIKNQGMTKRDVRKKLREEFKKLLNEK